MDNPHVNSYPKIRRTEHMCVHRITGQFLALKCVFELGIKKLLGFSE